jgi:hypothetical protein
MSRRERQAHREAVDAYYRQNGIEPPKRKITNAAEAASLDLIKYRTRVEQWLRERATSGKPPLSEPPPPVLPPGTQEALDAIAKHRSNTDTITPDTPTESPSEPSPESQQERKNIIDQHRRKGKTVAKKEEIVQALAAARDSIEQGVVAYAAQAADHIEAALQAIVATEGPLNSASGYVGTVYDSSDLIAYNSSLTGEMVELISELHGMLDKVVTYRDAAKRVVSFYNETIAREQAVGQ